MIEKDRHSSQWKVFDEDGQVVGSYDYYDDAQAADEDIKSDNHSVDIKSHKYYTVASNGPYEGPYWQDSDIEADAVYLRRSRARRLWMLNKFSSKF